jgi:hypothetical protein
MKEMDAFVPDVLSADNDVIDEDRLISQFISIGNLSNLGS